MPLQVSVHVIRSSSNLQHRTSGPGPEKGKKKRKTKKHGWSISAGVRQVSTEVHVGEIRTFGLIFQRGQHSRSAGEKSLVIIIRHP